MAHQTRPVIGINTDFVPASKHASPHVRLHAGYFDAVLAAGGLPILLPPVGKEAEINAFLDRLDGVVLCGGLDLDPKKQGLPSHPAVQPIADRRDDFDRLLIQRILHRRMPLLAIGLGMQQLNVARGGTLFLHLPEDQPRAMPHRDPTGGPHRHLVIIEPNTRLDEIYGGGELRVNSDHHQAVRQVGNQLRVAALAPDGVIEAIEGVDPDWFCVGVQWHPESETASALDMQLFECFVQACVRAAQPLALAA
ncbi:MAG: gamma-glutamyl-gamma-aminobutyrate hydrolase family protein [Gemmataceae bacterium]|nr:gamma-glutamyl-gamma-aminobutyrate hydrolase family protein [Gemmataceae bacterium]MDW8265587.1 gamma-glutamyl-gamma-aminobutyrate hydrolase family protein [Gemmataceae bacterium]